jgi:hypothetical protein
MRIEEPGCPSAFVHSDAEGVDLLPKRGMRADVRDDFPHARQ